MLMRGSLLLVILALRVATAWAQPQRSGPHIGYLYPAGGQQGTTFTITVGGQNLQGTAAAIIGGAGVRATVLDYARPLRQNQLNDLRQHLREILKQRYAELRGKKAETTPTEKVELPPLPEHPWTRDLDKKDIQELEELQAQLFNPKRQANSQIGEWVQLEITVDAGAQPGARELRLATRNDLTNPLRFEISTLPEFLEVDPLASAPPQTPLELPVVLNGQIMPGDVDRFHIKAKRGQNLMAQAHARRLIPYLADAVPGWFQATLALYDQQGKEVAFADDNEFDPDPALRYTVPEDGVYQLEIRDAIYRGREDFVYRIGVGELPLVTGIFPLGAQSGTQRKAKLSGWNLPAQQINLDTKTDGGVRPLVLDRVTLNADRIFYAVDSLNETTEVEPNDASNAQNLTLPQIVNGRIARAGDTDHFLFSGHAGDEIVAEVMARRLNSPLDSLVRLYDATGKVLAFNDDSVDKSAGLQTHHADSYLRFKLPADGVYQLEIADTQRRGGENFTYRLRVGPPQPDFALRVTPSSVSVDAGRVTVLTAFALRKDGFDGDIELILADAPEGFALSGARIPRGRAEVRFTLTAPTRKFHEPVALRLSGRATVGDKTISRPAVPADDMMQAFIYQHLVPAQELVLMVTPSRIAAPAGVISGDLPVRLAAGGTAKVQVKTGQRPILTGVDFRLNNAPKGVTLTGTTALADGLEFTLKAEKDVPIDYADNLIIEVHAPVAGRRTNLGYVPAIPVSIVKP